MPDTPQLGAKLTELAEKILDELLAEGSDASLAARVDALKAIGMLHLGLERLAGKMPRDDGDSGTTFDALRRRVATSEEE